MYQTRQEYFENIVKSEFPNLKRLLEKNMSLNNWGFRLNSSGVFSQFPPSLIYDSEFCRVRFMWDVPDPRDKFVKSVTVKYGRLHAPDDDRIITWQGERCYCWHSVDLAINFFDGISPSDIGVSYAPKIMKRYLQSNMLMLKELGLEGLDYAEIPIELITKMHSSIWENYGEQLFELLDLRCLALWGKYVNFVKEFYSLRGVIPGMSPSPDCIC